MVLSKSYTNICTLILFNAVVFSTVAQNTHSVTDMKQDLQAETLSGMGNIFSDSINKILGVSEIRVKNKNLKQINDTIKSKISDSTGNIAILIIEDQKHESEPISSEFKYIGDIVNNLKGGIKTGSIFMGLADIGISFNTEYAGWWKGGVLFLHGQSTHGGNASGKFIGDFQTMSNIENADFIYIYETWYKQSLGKFSVLLGTHDLNSEFNVTEYGSLYLNSSFGIMPNISANVPVSIFPKTCLAAVIVYQLSDKVILKGGIYDGDPGNQDNNSYNIDWSLSKEEGMFAIGEYQYHLIRNEKLTGTYKFGIYYHSRTFQSNNDISLYAGNYGLYGLVDQMIMSESNDSENGLGIFLQFGWCPADRNFNDIYVGGGFNYMGLLPSRNKDEIGLGIAHTGISKFVLSNTPEMLSYETAIELTYKAKLGNCMALQPDLHYIINPGLNPASDNAVVGSLRIELSF